MVRSVHPDLIAIGAGVHETELLMPYGSVHQLVNFWERKAIPRTCLIKISKVDAYPPLNVLLRDHQYVGEPFRVVDLPNEPCLGRCSIFFAIIFAF